MSKRDEIFNTLKAMSQNNKVWYSIKEATTYLDIDENTLSKKMIFYHIESRTLPGMKYRCISSKDVEKIKNGLNPTR